MGRRLGLEPRFIDGLRVTDDETMRVSQQVQIGGISRDVIAGIGRHGGRAIGLSGHDCGGFLQAAPRTHTDRETGAPVDLGRVGDVTSVDGDVLTGLLDTGLIPVIAPVAVDADQRSMNVNADSVATAIAQTLGATRLVFLTDVSGIRGPDDAEAAQVDASTLQEWIDTGIVAGGMIPKAEACLSALRSGVEAVTVADGRVPHALLVELAHRRRRRHPGAADLGDRVLNPSHPFLHTYARYPLTLVRGEGVRVQDDQGRWYLDACTGIAVMALGHAHPEVKAAVLAQLDGLWHGSNLVHMPSQQACAQRLSSAFDDAAVFFTNSGAEANEAAVKLVRKHHHRRGDPRTGDPDGHPRIPRADAPGARNDPQGQVPGGLRTPAARHPERGRRHPRRSDFREDGCRGDRTSAGGRRLPTRAAASRRSVRPVTHTAPC